MTKVLRLKLVGAFTAGVASAGLSTSLLRFNLAQTEKKTDLVDIRKSLDDVKSALAIVTHRMAVESEKAREEKENCESHEIPEVEIDLANITERLPVETGKTEGIAEKKPLVCVINMQNEDLQEVILNVNSWGGSLIQADLISSYIKEKSVKHKVPVISFVEDTATSCGYWLACAGKEIYACRNSLVGCIGVVYNAPWVSQWQHELVEEKQKLDDKTDKTTSYLTSCPNKLVGYHDVAMKENDLEIIQETVDDDHKIFVDVVKASRGERLQGTDLFTGRYWNAEKAEKLGLIDGIDSVDSYINRRWNGGVTVRRWYHPSPWSK